MTSGSISPPGQKYLAVQRLSQSDNFVWTSDHNAALAFRSEDQADALMMAVKQLAHFFNLSLFGFEASLWSLCSASRDAASFSCKVAM